MAKIKLQRKPRLEINEVIIESQVQENMSKDEYMALFNKKSSDAASLSFAIEDAKARLRQMGNLESTPELEELAKKLKLAAKINERGELMDKLQEMETTYSRLREEVKALEGLHTQLKALQGMQEAKKDADL